MPGFYVLLYVIKMGTIHNKVLHIFEGLFHVVILYPSNVSREHPRQPLQQLPEPNAPGAGHCGQRDQPRACPDLQEHGLHLGAVVGEGVGPGIPRAPAPIDLEHASSSSVLTGVKGIIVESLYRWDEHVLDEKDREEDQDEDEEAEALAAEGPAEKQLATELFAE